MMAKPDGTREENGETIVVHANTDEIATGTGELTADTYTHHCSIPGHRTSMNGKLTVN